MGEVIELKPIPKPPTVTLFVVHPDRPKLHRQAREIKFKNPLEDVEAVYMLAGYIQGLTESTGEVDLSIEVEGVERLTDLQYLYIKQLFLQGRTKLEKLGFVGTPETRILAIFENPLRLTSYKLTTV